MADFTRKVPPLAIVMFVKCELVDIVTDPDFLEKK